eukprot:1560361-Pleurochrysis_carterae.AAC.1
MNPGRCSSVQVGVKAPGMPSRTAVPLPSAVGRATGPTPAFASPPADTSTPTRGSGEPGAICVGA